jgi:hypothetical protein
VSSRSFSLNKIGKIDSGGPLSLNTPFDLLKTEINNSMSGLSFNISVIPVPAQNTLSFCDGMDLSVVDELARDLKQAALLGIYLLVATAILLLLGNFLWQWYHWRSLIRQLSFARDQWNQDPTPTNHNLLMLDIFFHHPLLVRLANWFARRFSLSPNAYVHLRWFICYVTYPPALVCLVTGLFGFLIVQVQLWSLGPISHKFDGLATAAVQNFSSVISQKINTYVQNQSAAYAQDVNNHVNSIQTTVNDGLFGWVNTTTTTLNNTVVAFYNEVENIVNTIFGGTVLASPAQALVQCFIGSKVEDIEKAITFLQSHLHVTLPLVDDTVLLLSPDSINEMTNHVANAAIGSGNGDDQGVLGRIVEAYVESLKKEKTMYLIFLALWGVVVFIAICIILWHSSCFGRRRGKSDPPEVDDNEKSMRSFMSIPTHRPTFQVRLPNIRKPDMPKVQFSVPTMPRLPAIPMPSFHKPSPEPPYIPKFSLPKFSNPFEGMTLPKPLEPEIEDDRIPLTKDGWTAEGALQLKSRLKRAFGIHNPGTYPVQQSRPNLTVSVERVMSFDAMPPNRAAVALSSVWSVSPEEPESNAWSRIKSFLSPALPPIDGVRSSPPITEMKPSPFHFPPLQRLPSPSPIHSPEIPSSSSYVVQSSSSPKIPMSFVRGSPGIPSPRVRTPEIPSSPFYVVQSSSSPKIPMFPSPQVRTPEIPSSPFYVAQSPKIPGSFVPGSPGIPPPRVRTPEIPPLSLPPSSPPAMGQNVMAVSYAPGSPAYRALTSYQQHQSADPLPSVSKNPFITPFDAGAFDG